MVVILSALALGYTFRKKCIRLSELHETYIYLVSLVVIVSRTNAISKYKYILQKVVIIDEASCTPLFQLKSVSDFSAPEKKKRLVALYAAH